MFRHQREGSTSQSLEVAVQAAGIVMRNLRHVGRRELQVPSLKKLTSEQYLTLFPGLPRSLVFLATGTSARGPRRTHHSHLGRVRPGPHAKPLALESVPADGLEDARNEMDTLARLVLQHAYALWRERAEHIGTGGGHRLR